MSGDTSVAELRDGKITEYTLNPRQFGMNVCSADKLAVRDIEEAKVMLQQALSQPSGAARDIVALNAGAAIYVAGLATSLVEGVAKAQAAITNGTASAKLKALVSFTQQFAPKP